MKQINKKKKEETNKKEDFIVPIPAEEDLSISDLEAE